MLLRLWDLLPVNRKQGYTGRQEAKQSPFEFYRHVWILVPKGSASAAETMILLGISLLFGKLSVER
jgi:hypothetical protein